MITFNHLHIYYYFLEISSISQITSESVSKNLYTSKSKCRTGDDITDGMT